MAIAYWTEFFDDSGALIQRVRTYSRVDAQVAFQQMKEGKRDDEIPAGTAHVVLFRGPKDMDSFWVDGGSKP